MVPLPISVPWANRRDTVSCNPVPQAGRLPVGRVLSPVIFFVSSMKMPVGCGIHIRYTDLVFGFSYQINLKVRRQTAQPFSGYPVCLFQAYFAIGPYIYRNARQRRKMVQKIFGP